MGFYGRVCWDLVNDWGGNGAGFPSLPFLPEGFLGVGWRRCLLTSHASCLRSHCRTPARGEEGWAEPCSVEGQLLRGLLEWLRRGGKGFPPVGGSACVSAVQHRLYARAASITAHLTSLGFLWRTSSSWVFSPFFHILPLCPRFVAYQNSENRLQNDVFGKIYVPFWDLDYNYSLIFLSLS